ncbi:MAG: hypothetical protein H6705_12825 [Myxococcales bacterium]|nr:hypothetical protein [Myxococcales bacterium]
MTRAPLAALLVAALVAPGCTRWVPVRADQLARLERGRTERVGEAPMLMHTDRYGRALAVTTTPVYETSRQTVLRPDGRTVEIVGRYDLRLTTGGQTKTFEHPVLVEQADDVLMIAGAETPETRFELSAIERAELSQGGGGSAAWIGVALAAVAIGVMLVYVD